MLRPFLELFFDFEDGLTHGAAGGNCDVKVLLTTEEELDTTAQVHLHVHIY